MLLRFGCLDRGSSRHRPVAARLRCLLDSALGSMHVLAYNDWAPKKTDQMCSSAAKQWYGRGRDWWTRESRTFRLDSAAATF